MNLHHAVLILTAGEILGGPAEHKACGAGVALLCAAVVDGPGEGCLCLPPLFCTQLVGQGKTDCQRDGGHLVSRPTSQIAWQS